MWPPLTFGDQIQYIMSRWHVSQLSIIRNSTTSMPATRSHRRQRTKAAAPLPRITDPYAPRDEDDPVPVTAEEKLAEERGRVAANKAVCRLLKKHGTCGLGNVQAFIEFLCTERTVAAAASLVNDAERKRKTSETWVNHFMAGTCCNRPHFQWLLIGHPVVRAYECRYGKFVPDAENAAWQARKKPRMEELYKLRAVARE